MAKQDWVHLNVVDRVGNGSFEITADDNVGRSQRSCTLTVAGTGAASKSVSVSQSGIGVYLAGRYPVFERGSLSTPPPPPASQSQSSGANTTASGTIYSNAYALRISLIDKDGNAQTGNARAWYLVGSSKTLSVSDCNSNTISAQAKYYPNGGNETSSGNAVPQDMGENNTANSNMAVCYSVDVSVTFTNANTTGYDEYVIKRIEALDSSGAVVKTLDITFVHPKSADASISLDTTSVSFDAGAGTAGTTKTINVTSNINWSVS